MLHFSSWFKVPDCTSKLIKCGHWVHCQYCCRSAESFNLQVMWLWEGKTLMYKFCSAQSEALWITFMILIQLHRVTFQLIYVWLSALSIYRLWAKNAVIIQLVVPIFCSVTYLGTSFQKIFFTKVASFQQNAEANAKSLFELLSIPNTSSG